jgi:hypothetical protein
MYELKLAIACALACAVGFWLVGRSARLILRVVTATRWGRRRATRRAVYGYTALFTHEGEEALQRFAREFAEDFSAALDASGISKRL